MGGLRQLKFLGGLVVVLIGVLWAGQGSGTIPYPATSPMRINQTNSMDCSPTVAGA